MNGISGNQIVFALVISILLATVANKQDFERLTGVEVNFKEMIELLLSNPYGFIIILFMTISIVLFFQPFS